MKKLFSAMAFFAITASVVAQPKIGDTVNDISPPGTDGKINKLSELRGKVVLVDFWASWCVPCRKSNKALAPVYAAFNHKGFEIYAVSLDDEVGAWKKAIAADKIKWIQVHQAGGWNAPVANEWKIEQLPTSYLLDKEGRVLAIDPSKEIIESHLKKLAP